METNDIPSIQPDTLPKLLEAEVLLPLPDSYPDDTAATILPWEDIRVFWNGRFQQWAETAQPVIERIQSIAIQTVELLTSEVAQRYYRQSLRVVGTALTISAITLLYLGIACYLAGATCRKLLNKNTDTVLNTTSITEVSHILAAIAHLPLSTQTATEEMISKAEVAVAQSRQLLVPMRQFVEQLANLYQAQLTTAAPTLEVPLSDTIHHPDPSLAIPSAIAVLPKSPSVADTIPPVLDADSMARQAQTTATRKTSNTRQRRTARLKNTQEAVTPVPAPAGI